MERRGSVPPRDQRGGSDRARQGGDGQCEALAPERSAGVNRSGCPLGAAMNKCLRVVEAAGTTLTAHTMGRLRTGQSWKNYERSEHPALGMPQPAGRGLVPRIFAKLTW